ncbi:MAG: hypothetical protein GX188_08575 [Syntrophomonadaceae bacterium]|nr:hypothetical protein [Syntrophomonadaceae bacterium]
MTKKSSPALDEEDSDQDDEEELPVEDIQEESDSEETVSDDVLEYMGLEDYSSGENDEISEEAEIDPSEDEDSVSQRPRKLRLQATGNKAVSVLDEPLDVEDE